MSDTQSGFFDSLVSAVRDNPLAAALIGGGAFWLLVGNDKLKSVANSATAAASPMVDGARNLRAATSGLQRTAAPRAGNGPRRIIPRRRNLARSR